MGSQLDVEEDDLFCVGGVTQALVVHHGDVPVSERSPKNRQQLSVAVPKIEHPGA